MHDRIGCERQGACSEEVQNALQAYEMQLAMDSVRVHMKLVPGMAALVDNWQVLHAREGYHGGRRRLVGADFPDAALLGMRMY